MESRPTRVLLIEDDEDDYVLTRDLLGEIKGDRFHLDWERTYEGGLAAIARAEHDVYLADYRLGEHTGLDLLRQAMALGLKAPVILLTGEGSEETDLQAMRFGAADFLIKGQFGAPMLERSIRYSIQQAKTLEALRQSKEFAERIINSSVDGIMAFDRARRFTVWNGGMEQMTGVGRQEVLGRPAEEVFPFLAEIGEDRFMCDVLGGNNVVTKDRPYHVAATGKKGFFEAHYSPLRSEAGEIIGGLAIVRDITERRRLEEQFRHSQKLEAVGRLAGGVAHDFNNLLTAITGYSELLLGQLRQEGELRANVEEIRKAAQRAAALTSQLLTFSKRRSLQTKVLSLCAVVADMEGMLRRVIGDDVELVVEADPEAGRVRADRGQLEQVVMNLVVNARDAMPEGGRVRICTRSRKLEGVDAGAEEVPPGDYVILRISDTGTGMTPDTLQHLFEPFFTTKEPDKGTGLGLSTVYGIVQQSGGQIRVTSEMGRGTTFSIYLPRVYDAVEETETRAGGGAAARGGETILVVEDQETVRRLVGKILRMSGYRVLDAPDGREALLLCRQSPQPIHLLITDLMMPHLGGGLLAQQLRQSRPEMAVLFVSGYSNENLDDVALENITEHQFLQKPFTMEQLIQKVRALLDGH